MQLDYSLVECQALVLPPTLELAQQSVKVHACVGGTSVREDQRILSSGVHVVVGTPGRVFDMLRRQSLRPVYIKMAVEDSVIANDGLRLLSMAKERMKWKSTLGLMGTSEKRMLLPSAPMYSLKSFEFVGAAWISEEVAMKTWKMHKQTRIFDEAMLIGCRVSVSTSEWHEMGWDILLSNVNTEPKKHKHFRSTAMTVNFMLPSHIQPFGGSFEMESLSSFRFLGYGLRLLVSQKALKSPLVGVGEAVFV
ncbi:unnamed protein product [Camellia sinensis]